jgi:hypothetical protein
MLDLLFYLYVWFPRCLSVEIFCFPTVDLIKSLQVCYEINSTLEAIFLELLKTIACIFSENVISEYLSGL